MNTQLDLLQQALDALKECAKFLVPRCTNGDKAATKAKTVIAAIEAAQAQSSPAVELPVAAWQPIETAPRDGTEILGVNDDGIPCVIRWSKHNHVPLYGWIRQIELYGEECDGFSPLAWMPIPDAKAIIAAAQGAKP